ncbi:MAG TPA: TIGR02677 family protein [Chthoniobacterales bacterium]
MRNEQTAEIGNGLRTHTVFTHVLVEKAELYRMILEGFVRAREQFITHLRPAEVAREIGCNDEEAENALRKLQQWGNVEATQDSAEAVSIDEFYRSRFLYALSAAGEAAERALAIFEETLHRPGELQTAALRDITEFLEGIRVLLAGAEPDVPKLHTQLLGLTERFRNLTNRAQAFMRDLQSTVQLHGMSVEQFLGYKQLLIDYLERFLRDLVLATNEISQKILLLEQAGIRDQFGPVARRSLADALTRTREMEEREIASWEGRWHGLRRWFLGEPGVLSQSEILRARAREAIPALLFTLQNINDQRVTRSDRFTDWQTLAVWFAETATDEEAHRLWRVAFGLAPARHLQINQETLDLWDQAGDGPRTPWLAAEPLRISPRLRVNGRLVVRSQATAVVDRGREKAELARLAADEAVQIARAQRELALNRPLRLTDFGRLDTPAFYLLLDLLGEALAMRTDPREPVEAASMDGALLVRLGPEDDPVRLAEIVTTTGVLRGPDCEVTISYAHLTPAAKMVAGESRWPEAPGL